MLNLPFAVLVLLFAHVALAPSQDASAAPASEQQAQGARGSAAPQPGELELTALARAYPDRITEVAWRDGDWALKLDDRWYSWAQGRVLVEEEKEEWEAFASLRFYRYPKGLPPLPQLDETARRRLRERLDEQDLRPPDRSERFLAQLYRAENREEMEARLVSTTFLGLRVSVHSMIASRLAAVERRVEALRQQDPQVRAFVAGLAQASGFHWREIAGTASRSYHAYGVAVDLIPRSYDGRQYYWRNIFRSSDVWYELPYERRWMVPLPVVEAFEAEGFIWGGKWLYFDTVHFEYRPELLILREEADRPGRPPTAGG